MAIFGDFFLHTYTECAVPLIAVCCCVDHAVLMCKASVRFAVRICSCYDNLQQCVATVFFVLGHAVLVGVQHAVLLSQFLRLIITTPHLLSLYSQSTVATVGRHVHWPWFVVVVLLAAA